MDSGGALRSSTETGLFAAVSAKRPASTTMSPRLASALSMVSLPAPWTVRAVVASKMLYASHYFWTGLEVRALVPDPERGPGFWFVTVNRARSDGLSGFTGMFVRRRVRSEVQQGVLASLRTTKRKLEQSR